MVEGEFFGRAAILAGEAIAQENIKAREGGKFRRLDIGFQANDAGQFELEIGTSHHAVIFGNDVHPVHKHGLDRVLPAPNG